MENQDRKDKALEIAAYYYDQMGDAHTEHTRLEFQEFHDEGKFEVWGFRPHPSKGETAHCMLFLPTELLELPPEEWQPRIEKRCKRRKFIGNIDRYYGEDYEG